MNKPVAVVLAGAVIAVLLSQNARVQDQTVDNNKRGVPVEFELSRSDDFNIGVFAKDLSNPRDLQVSPGGTLLVSIPNQGRIVALVDKDNDGVSEETKVVISGLNRPHGITFLDATLYIAEETGVARYNWDEQSLEAKLDKKLIDLPWGGRHFTRSVTFDNQGRLFVSIGSTCDVCVENHPWLGTVIVSDKEGNNPQVYSKGLRNAVFLTKNPKTGEVWVTEMGRDFLGDNKPPDEINILQSGADFGWPRCFGDKIPDSNFNSNLTQQDCNNTSSPVFEIQAHSAPLGLTFINSTQFPPDWQGDLLVAYHGSWNRSTPVGYKIVRLEVDEGKVVGEEDFIGGFLQNGNVSGRPVDMEFDKEGSLFISDDKAGFVYIVRGKP